MESKKEDDKAAFSLLKSKLRTIPGFPRAGVNFIDITPLLSDANAFKFTIDKMTEFFLDKKIDVIAGIEARGFILAAPVAYKLGLPFVPARKSGKLPSKKLSEEYALEYGLEFLEMHSDAISKGQRVGIVDDLLATGGTARAAARLIERLGGRSSAFAFIVELDFLKGREKLEGYDLFSLVHYSE